MYRGTASCLAAAWRDFRAFTALKRLDLKAPAHAERILAPSVTALLLHWHGRGEETVWLPDLSACSSLVSLMVTGSGAICIHRGTVPEQDVVLSSPTDLIRGTELSPSIRVQAVDTFTFLKGPIGYGD